MTPSVQALMTSLLHHGETYIRHHQYHLIYLKWIRIDLFGYSIVPEHPALLLVLDKTPADYMYPNPKSIYNSDGQFDNRLFLYRIRRPFLDMLPRPFSVMFISHFRTNLVGYFSRPHSAAILTTVHFGNLLGYNRFR